MLTTIDDIHDTTLKGSFEIHQSVTDIEFVHHLRQLCREAHDSHDGPRRRSKLFDKMGNPTTLGLSVFAVTNTMIAIFLMQARGIKHTDVQVGMLWFTGGVASWLTAIFELFRGNTFAWTVFGSFGGYYFAYASILTPSFQTGVGYPAEQLEQQLGVFFCCWAALFFVFLALSVRTNLAFVYIFLTVDITTWLFAAEHFQLARGEDGKALVLEKIAGGFLLACSMAGWYLLIVQLAEALKFQYRLPVGDLVRQTSKVGAEDSKLANPRGRILAERMDSVLV